VQCCLDENEYPKAIKVSDAEMAGINLACDDFHGEWNYTISPQPCASTEHESSGLSANPASQDSPQLMDRKDDKLSISKSEK